MVTAMVSPRARPSPRMIPPRIPARALRSTPTRIISQRVAPKREHAFPLMLRHHHQHFARDRGNDGDDHDRQDDSRRQHADPVRSAGQTVPSTQSLAPEMAPHTCSAAEPAQTSPTAHKSRWESQPAIPRKTTAAPRNALGHISVVNTATPTESGTAMISASQRRNQRPVDEGQGAKFLADRIPFAAGEELESEGSARKDAERVINS